jgi:hypothetical protein
MERVYFVCKKVVRGKAQYEVGEVGNHIPAGFHEVQKTRTLQLSNAICKKKDLAKRDSQRPRRGR